MGPPASNAATSPAPPAPDAPPCLALLRIRPAGAEAVRLWQHGGWLDMAPLDGFLDALTGVATQHSLLPDNVTHVGDVAVVHDYFATQACNEVVRITLFARFLGGHATLADALKALIGPAAATATATTVGSPTAVTPAATAGVAATADCVTADAASPLPTTAAASSPPPATALPAAPTAAAASKRPSVSLKAMLNPVGAGTALARHIPRCCPGTREWIFKSIEAWAALPPMTAGRRLFWLKGAAGMGKTVIAAQLVARYGLGQDASTPSSHAGLRLRGYYFCVHDDRSRNDPRRVVATLAYRLACMLPKMQAQLETLFADASTCAEVLGMIAGDKGSLFDLYSTVLAAPLQAALPGPSQQLSDIFLLVDGLDELAPGPSRQQLLRLLSQGFPSLPVQVRFIITSRPDDDIVAHFRRINSYAIDKQDDKQLADMRLYAQKHILPQSGLRNAPPAETEEVVNELLNKADGNFLALHMAGVAIRDLAAEGAKTGGEPLSAAAVVDSLRARPDLTDSVFAETLHRVHARLTAAADGDADLEAEFLQTLRQVLAALLAAQQPLLLSDVPLLCGGLVRRSDALTSRLLAALAPLFSAANASSPVEPLHKTVADFLRDKERAGPHHVDEREGHAMLALATFRVLREHYLLPAVDLDSDGDAQTSAAAVIAQLPRGAEAKDICDHHGAVQYVLRHGLAHLASCAAALTDASCPSTCRTAILHWQEQLLVQRPPVDAAALSQVPLPSPHAYSTQAASLACGAWLVLAAHTTGRKRGFNHDLAELDAALSSCRLPAAKGVGEPLAKLVREMMLGFSALWAPADNIAASASRFLNNTTLLGYLHRSPAADAVMLLVGAERQLVKVPGLLSSGTCLGTLEGNGDAVTSVAYSPDGTRILSGGWDNAVRMWDARTGETIVILSGHTETVIAVGYSPDGRRIASGSEDTTVRVWHAETGETLHTLVGHTSFVMSVAFSPDSGRIASGSEDHSVRVWNAQTGEAVSTLDGHSDYVMSVAYSADGSCIASGSNDRTIIVWDAQTFAALHTLEGHTSFVTSVCFSPDCKSIVSGSWDWSVRVWDAQTGSAIFTLDGHKDSVTSVAFSPDGQRIVSASWDKTVRVWDAQTGEAISTRKAHINHVTSVAFSPDSHRILSGGLDVRIWDAHVSDAVSTLDGHTDSVSCVVFGPDGERIVTGSFDNTVRVWDSRTGEAVGTLKGHSHHVTSIVVSPDGKRIVSGSKNGTARVWDAQTGKTINTLEGHSDSVWSVAYSPDGKRIVTGSEDKSVRTWNAQTGKTANVLNGHRSVVLAVAYNLDGKRVVSGSADNTVRVWDAIAAKALFCLEGHASLVAAVAFSPDGMQIVSGSHDSTLRVWNAQAGDLVHTLHGHSGPVVAVVVSPGGKRIVSGSADMTIRVWDVQSGDAIISLNGHSHQVLGVAFSPDGNRIASCGRDNSVRLWDAHHDDDHADLPRMSQARVSRFSAWSRATSARFSLVSVMSQEQGQTSACCTIL